MSTLALDIGGANLKAVAGSHHAENVPFELWREPHALTDRLRGVFKTDAGSDRLAVTMTGEICDCFETKTSGVLHILDAVERAADGRFERESIRVWTTDARLTSLEEARDRPLSCAASNWLALATWAARELSDDNGLLVDIGSTTTDIVALRQGKARPVGLDDTSRLRSGELVYRGVRRTPISCVLQAVALGAHTIPLAAETFATTLDAYLVLGKIPPRAEDRDTADGRPATVEYAKDRLARALCLDPPELSESDAFEIALQVAGAIDDGIRGAISRVQRARSIESSVAFISGSGEFLARRNVERSFERIISLSELVGTKASEAACAFALAQLARD